jgi:hypothetical protein
MVSNLSEKMMKNAGSTGYGQCSNSTCLFKLMRKEYLELVDHIAKDISSESTSNHFLYDQVQQQLDGQKVASAATRQDGRMMKMRMQ